MAEYRCEECGEQWQGVMEEYCPACKSEHIVVDDYDEEDFDDDIEEEEDEEEEGEEWNDNDDWGDSDWEEGD